MFYKPEGRTVIKSPSFWHKQSIGQPLYKDLFWSRPENKIHAGKLLIIGGSSQTFRAPAEAYAASTKTGIGSARVILPDSLKTQVSKIFAPAVFAPSSNGGGFAKISLDRLLEESAWADIVLLAGGVGKNSETAILLESFVDAYKGPLCLCEDVLEHFIKNPNLLLKRQSSLIVSTLSQLQKMVSAIKFTTPITTGMDLMRLTALLHELTLLYQSAIIVKHLDNFIVASGGEVGTTNESTTHNSWTIALGSIASVWWAHNPKQVFKALNCATYEYLSPNNPF